MSTVNAQNPPRDAHVRVSVFTRDRLKEIGDGDYCATIARIAGYAARVNTKPTGSADSVGRYDETTTIRVSADCKAVLERMKADWGVSSFGAVVSLCVENWRP